MAIFFLFPIWAIQLIHFIFIINQFFSLLISDTSRFIRRSRSTLGTRTWPGYRRLALFAYTMRRRRRSRSWTRLCTRTRRSWARPRWSIPWRPCTRSSAWSCTRASTPLVAALTASLVIVVVVRAWASHGRVARRGAFTITRAAATRVRRRPRAGTWSRSRRRSVASCVGFNSYVACFTLFFLMKIEKVFIKFQ